MTPGDRYAEFDAAYVLGALTPSERREFESHKADCARCAAAVEELAGLPGLLASVPQADVRPDLAGGEDTAPAAVLTGLLDSARGQRLRRRLIGASLAAAAVIALTVGVAASSWREHPRTAALTQLIASPVHADVRFAAEPWGTRIDLTCTYQGPKKPVPGAERYGYLLVVTNRAGKQTVAASWRTTAGTTVTPTGSVDVPLADIAQVQVQASNGTPLLQLNR